jgi:DNA polymerase
MQILTIDFETYYDRTFSLSKMTTEEYIRSELFETIGVAVKVDGGETQWFSGPKAATKKFLKQFDWAKATAVAHNAVFDMAILNWQFDIRPKRIVDTLSMARAVHGTEVGGSLKALTEHYELGEKGTEVLNALGKGRLDFTKEELDAYGSYCINDVDLTYALFERLAVGFPTNEFKLIDLTLRMFTEPVLTLDKTKLKKHIDNVVERKEELLSKALIDKADLMSNPKLADILRQLGVEPPMKVSPTTGKETYAFAKSDEAFKALLDHSNYLVQAVVAARLGVKSTLEETRTQRFLDIADRGTLPIPLRYYAAHTGRWGGDDKINMQNLPRSSPLKYAIQAPQGYELIDSDSSQIEARMLAWLAGQQDLVDFFDKNNEEIALGIPKSKMQYDPYKIMASQIYGTAVDEVTDAQRFVGKTTILGAGYGMGAAKFQAQLKTFNVKLTIEECERIIRVYRESYPKIPMLWKKAGKALESMMRGKATSLGTNKVLGVEGKDGIRLPNGLRIKYPNLRKQRDEDGKEELVYDTKKGRAVIPNRIYGGKVVENVCQALARIVIGDQMLMVARKHRVVMTVHDAIASVVPKDEVTTAQKFIETCMRVRPSWAADLPLNCEAGHGLTYGDCK